MKTITITAGTTTDEIRQALQEIDEPEVVLEWADQPVLRAIVIKITDDDLEWHAFESSAKFRESIARARKQTELTSLEDIKEELSIGE
jgi:hypothetical protein